MSSLALSDSFEYLCYGSMTIRDILILSVRGPDGPRTERVNLPLLPCLYYDYRRNTLIGPTPEPLFTNTFYTTRSISLFSINP